MLLLNNINFYTFSLLLAAYYCLLLTTTPYYCPLTNATLLVGLDGFEQSTPALSRRCSNQLSYRPESDGGG